MRALIIGGTAATGRPLVAELLARGYEVAVYHRGEHELDLPPEVEHVHGDPHVEEQLERDLAGRRFDATVATYGRLRVIARVLRGRTAHLVSIGGVPVMRDWYPISDPHYLQHLRPVAIPASEAFPLERSGVDRLIDRIRESEEAVLAAHREGAYVATHMRYPYLYGPHSVIPHEWGVVKRVLDGRGAIALPGGGQVLWTRCAAANAAHAIALALDQPELSGGQIYHVGDQRQFTQRQWVEHIAAALGHEFELLEIPWSFAPPGFSYAPEQVQARHHRLLDTSKLRAQLGYRDAVPAEQALAETARWLVEHPPATGDGRNILDPFDYAAEDRLIEAWRGVEATFEPLEAEPVVWRRSYERQPAPGEPPSHPADAASAP